MKKEKFGFIKKDGSFLIEPFFNDAQCFSEGLAGVEENGYYGYIDISGEMVIEPEFDWVSLFHNGIARVRKDELIYYIDKKGLPIKSGFEDKLNILREVKLGKSLQSVTSRFAEEKGNGEMIVYPSDSDYSEGLGKYEYFKDIRSKSKYGFMDKERNIIIPSKFSEVENFSEGLAAVCNRGKWRYINAYGKYAFKCMFDDAWSFQEHVARVKIIDKWGYINHDGEYIIKPQFKTASDFSDGFAFVRKSNKAIYYYINKENKNSFDKYFSLVRQFKEGVAFAGNKGKFGLIDKSGKYLIEPIFDFCDEFNEGIATVSVKE